MVQEAQNMIAEDEARNRKIGEFGAACSRRSLAS